MSAIQDITETWNNDGIAFYKGSNMYKLMDALSSELDRQEAEAEEIRDSHHINDATGVNLDKIGALAGIDRRIIRDYAIQTTDDISSPSTVTGMSSNKFTFSTTFKIIGSFESFDAIIKFNWVNAGGFIAHTNVSGILDFKVTDNVAAEAAKASATNIELDTEYTAVGTIDTDTGDIELWIDGIKVDTDNGSIEPFDPADGPISVSPATDDIEVNNVQCWSRVLTDTEIQLVTDGEEVDTSRFLYWTFDDLDPNTVTDESGNGNDGTINDVDPTFVDRSTREKDAKFRQRIKLETRVGSIGTTFDDVAEFFFVLLNADEDTLEFDQRFAADPATLYISADSQIYDNSSLTRAEISAFGNRVVPAGHEVKLEEVGTFRLKTDGEVDDPDKGLTSDGISTGGTLSTDI